MPRWIFAVPVAAALGTPALAGGGDGGEAQLLPGVGATKDVREVYTPAPEAPVENLKTHLGDRMPALARFLHASPAVEKTLDPAAALNLSDPNAPPDESCEVTGVDFNLNVDDLDPEDWTMGMDGAIPGFDKAVFEWVMHPAAPETQRLNMDFKNGLTLGVEHREETRARLDFNWTF